MNQFLCDVDILLDAYLDRDPTCVALLRKLVEHDQELFLTASMLSNLTQYLAQEGIDRQTFLDEFLKNIRIVSVTGKEFREALKHHHSEEALTALCFKRACPEGVIITRNPRFQNFSIPIYEPHQILQLLNENYIENTPKSLPLLDLAKEYRYLQEEIDQALLSTIAEARYILGPQVSLLEKRLSEYLGVNYCVGVASGTDALVLALRALALLRNASEYWSDEDLIITTPFTFTATAMAILRAGATPLFVDIDLETYNIDPLQIQQALQEYGNRVKGIIAVHLYGNPCDMDAIMQIAQQYDLFVIEDCAQSLGSKWRNRQTGSFGDLGCFSFFPTKNLGGFGDGGMVSTNSEALYQLLSMLRKQGGKDKYNVSHIGYNSRLDTLQATILLTKMAYLDEFVYKRREIAAFYNYKLRGIEAIVLPKENEPYGYHSYHQYTVRVKADRNSLEDYLKANGVASMVYYPYPLNTMQAFAERHVSFGELKNAQIASKSVLSLPIGPLVNKSEIFRIIELFGKYFSRLQQ